MSDGVLRDVMIRREGYKDGYEKGVRDMWEASWRKCNRLISIEFESPDGIKYGTNTCKECENENNDYEICTFEICPIAQKLLKGVTENK